MLKTVVLSGAFLVFGTQPPTFSGSVPHPASASQLSTAPGSHPLLCIGKQSKDPGGRANSQYSRLLGHRHFSWTSWYRQDLAR